MGLVGKLLSFARLTRNGAEVSDTKLDPGGGANVTAPHFASPGDDSHPLPGDYVLGVRVPGSGTWAAAGYLDPKNSGAAQAGEKRLYARDAAGVEIVQLHLKADGTATLFNDSGSVTLQPDGSAVSVSPGGTFELLANGEINGSNSGGSFSLQSGGAFLVNGVTIDTSGNITTPATLTAAAVVAPSVMAGGKELTAHTHAQASDSGGDSQPPTGPNL